MSNENDELMMDVNLDLLFVYVDFLHLFTKYFFLKKITYKNLIGFFKLMHNILLHKDNKNKEVIRYGLLFLAGC